MNEIDATRFCVFTDNLYEGVEGDLTELEKEALLSDIPIIRKDTQGFLAFLLKTLRPKRILEVGTAVGFSAIFFCRLCDADVVTMESYEKRIPIAKENFRRFGVEDRVTLLEGDAAKLLDGIEGAFDFVFLDAAKGQYQVYLEKCLPRLHPGSVIVSDNVLFDGAVLESKYAVERRDRTIHKRMRDFLYDTCHDPRLTSSLLPVGDGLLVSVVV